MDDRKARAYQITKWRMTAERAREHLEMPGRWDEEIWQGRLDHAEYVLAELMAEQAARYPGHGGLQHIGECMAAVVEHLTQQDQQPA
jgi:hypothetical protein